MFESDQPGLTANDVQGQLGPFLARITDPAPASATDPLFVIIRSFDGGRHQHGPCLWEPPAGALPADGELCVVARAIEEDGEGEQVIVLAFDRDDSAATDADLAAHAALTGAAHIKPVVDTLPGSPVDGQEAYFQNAAMATLGIVWQLRYRAGSASPYKWECVGAQEPLVREAIGNPTTVTANVATYIEFVGGGSRITVPLSGEYAFGVRDLTAQAPTAVTAAEGRLTGLIVGGAQFGGLVGGAGLIDTFELQTLNVEMSRQAFTAGQLAALAYATNNKVVNWNSFGQAFTYLRPLRVG